MNENLYHRRVAHLVLTIAQRALGLGSLAKIFDADDLNLISHAGNNVYKFFRPGNRSFCTIELYTPTQAYLHCDSVYDLVRDECLREFHPEELGIEASGPLMLELDIADELMEREDLLRNMPQRRRVNNSTSRNMYRKVYSTFGT
ncbi:hypothetical protein N9H39_05520 [Gammaproteobacteria bacterium]|nr:hypothetical protein [Gammaproteobacteria bacterium]